MKAKQMKAKKDSAETKRIPRTKRTPRTKRKERAKRTVSYGALIGLLLLISGCARFSTTQTDMRYEGGKPSTAITTVVKSSTLFSSKSDLANFSASQTEKTQGAKVGALHQQGATNTAGVIRELRDLLEEVNALKRP